MSAGHNVTRPADTQPHPPMPKMVIAGDIGLRDYFAAKAMQALIPLYYTGLDFDLNERAYQTADNMLRARGAA